MDFNQKIGFLYKSIEDTQSTIRAVDIKASFMFVVVFLPITALKNILTVGNGLITISHNYWWIITPTIVLWTISLYFLFKTIVSISNPAEKIDGEKPNGLFYGASLFSLSKIDYFFNFPIKSKKHISDYVKIMPTNEEELVRELIFEKMKLIYIRDIKIHRSNFLFKATIFWLVFGGISWALYLFLKVI